MPDILYNQAYFEWLVQCYETHESHRLLVGLMGGRLRQGELREPVDVEIVDYH